MTQQSVQVTKVLPNWLAGPYVAMDTGNAYAVLEHFSDDAQIPF